MSYEQDVQEYEASYEEDTRECEAMRKMFVGGLNRDTAEADFFGHFEQFGTMVDKVIITDPHTKQSRGFGFITYDKSDNVEAVFKERPHCIDGKSLDVKRAMPREFNTQGAHSKTKKLFIGGFKGLNLQPEELREYIESRHLTDFGRIENIDFLKDKDGLNKGFGFLEASNTDFADRLAISENSFKLKGRTMSIKKAEPQGSMGGGGGAPRGGGNFRGSVGRGRGGDRGGGRGRGGDRGGYNNYATANSYSNNQGSGYNQGGGGGYQQAAGGGYQQGGGGGYQQSSGGGYQQSSGGGYQQGGGGGYPQGGGGGYQQSSGGGYQQGGGGYQQGGGGGYPQGGGGYQQGGANIQVPAGGYNQAPTSGYSQNRGGGRGGSGGQRYQPY